MFNVGLIIIWQSNKSIVLSMSANEFTEVPHTIGCKISQDITCVKVGYNRMETFAIGEQ